jgi:hypothetical protein
VLVELNHHRSLEELSTWFGVPEKRLRQLLRAHRTSGGVAGVTGPTTWPNCGRARRAWQRCRWLSRPRRKPHPLRTVHRHRRHLPPHQLRLRVARVRPAPSRPPAPGDRFAPDGHTPWLPPAMTGRCGCAMSPTRPRRLGNLLTDHTDSMSAPPSAPDGPHPGHRQRKPDGAMGTTGAAVRLDQKPRCITQSAVRL